MASTIGLAITALTSKVGILSRKASIRLATETGEKVLARKGELGRNLNVEEIEQVFAEVLLNNNDPSKITLDRAKEILKDSISKDKPTIISPQYILEIVADYYNIDTDDITSKKRNADIVLPRQIFMYLCREMTDVTLEHVATILDKKDHSTIIHGCKKIDEEIKINTQLKDNIEAIKTRIYSQ